MDDSKGGPTVGFINSQAEKLIVQRPENIWAKKLVQIIYKGGIYWWETGAEEYTDCTSAEE